jgi:Mn2+/Fe2+ NRAMP family transporter
MVVVAVVVVLAAGNNLIPILYLTQALNAILLPPLLVLMWRIGRDPSVMGGLVTSPPLGVAQFVALALVSASVVALAATAVA